ncbi:MAG TPA: hypothetical protein VG943_07020 [Caulobacterales bacterium]|nr:hypothetical protein [Caulobacterales bacterium]
MSVPIRYILAAIAFGIAVLGFVLLPTAAHACDQCQPPPPPPCHCEPPPSCTACSESHASAHAEAFSVNVARARTPDVVLRNRGGGVDVSVYAGVESSFAMGGGADFAAADAGVSLRAVCVDPQGVERMASQTFADRDVPRDFAGEIHRCAAGLRMRATVQGRVYECAPAQALWFERGVAECRAQIARARGYEQQLIARYGYTDKVVILTQSASSSEAPAAPFAQAQLGGVGGF